MEKEPLSVSEFLNLINAQISEDEFAIAGEVTGFKLHPAGVFFSVKDSEDSLLRCYLSPYLYRSLGVEFEDGSKVVINGYAEIYKRRGDLTMKVNSIALAGEGELKKAYEELKKKLEAEGLFERKRELPEFISRVAIITSNSGAVIDDFRKNIKSLGLNLTLADSRVEGAKAVSEILAGIKYFNAHHEEYDVLVVMRGGGSLEDLQAFNNEKVARAIFASKIPTIAAVGHDRDVPIANLVADVAVSTPTAAAVRVNSSWDSLLLALPQLSDELVHRFELNFLPDFSNLGQSISMAFESLLETIKVKLKTAESLLAAHDPRNILKLGYSITLNESGKTVKSANNLKVGDELKTQFAKGSIWSKINKKEDA